MNKLISFLKGIALGTGLVLISAAIVSSISGCSSHPDSAPVVSPTSVANFVSPGGTVAPAIPDKPHKTNQNGQD